MDITEHLLEDCRWLFNQEVKILTFKLRLPNGQSSKSWHAVVVPKQFSLTSLAQCDINEEILIQGSSGGSCASEDAIYNLHQKIGDRIGQILRTNSDGSFFIEESEIPKCDAPITIESTKTTAVSSSTQTDPVLGESIGEQKGNEQEKSIQMKTKETPKGKEKGGKVEKQSTWRWAPGPSGRPHWEEYEPEVPNADNLSSPMKASGPTTTSAREAGINPGTSTASSKTKTRKSLLPVSDRRRSSSSSSSSQQPTIKTSSEYATSGSEIEFTDSNSDSETTTVPRLDHFDPVGTDQQMVRDEIKFAMRDLLKCLAEHVEGIS